MRHDGTGAFVHGQLGCTTVMGQPREEIPSPLRRRGMVAGSVQMTMYPGA